MPKMYEVGVKGLLEKFDKIRQKSSFIAWKECFAVDINDENFSEKYNDYMIFMSNGAEDPNYKAILSHKINEELAKKHITPEKFEKLYQWFIRSENQFSPIYREYIVNGKIKEYIGECIPETYRERYEVAIRGAPRDTLLKEIEINLTQRSPFTMASAGTTTQASGALDAPGSSSSKLALAPDEYGHRTQVALKNLSANDGEMLQNLGYTNSNSAIGKAIELIGREYLKPLKLRQYKGKQTPEKRAKDQVKEKLVMELYRKLRELQAEERELHTKNDFHDIELFYWKVKQLLLQAQNINATGLSRANWPELKKDDDKLQQHRGENVLHSALEDSINLINYQYLGRDPRRAVSLDFYKFNRFSIADQNGGFEVDEQGKIKANTDFNFTERCGTNKKETDQFVKIVCQEKGFRKGIKAHTSNEASFSSHNLAFKKQPTPKTTQEILDTLKVERSKAGFGAKLEKTGRKGAAYFVTKPLKTITAPVVAPIKYLFSDTAEYLKEKGRDLFGDLNVGSEKQRQINIARQLIRDYIRANKGVIEYEGFWNTVNNGLNVFTREISDWAKENPLLAAACGAMYGTGAGAVAGAAGIPVFLTKFAGSVGAALSQPGPYGIARAATVGFTFGKLTAVTGNTIQKGSQGWLGSAKEHIQKHPSATALGAGALLGIGYLISQGMVGTEILAEELGDQKLLTGTLVGGKVTLIGVELLPKAIKTVLSPVVGVLGAVAIGLGAVGALLTGSTKTWNKVKILAEHWYMNYIINPIETFFQNLQKIGRMFFARLPSMVIRVTGDFLLKGAGKICHLLGFKNAGNKCVNAAYALHEKALDSSERSGFAGAGNAATLGIFAWAEEKRKNSKKRIAGYQEEIIEINEPGSKAKRIEAERVAQLNIEREIERQKQREQQEQRERQEVAQERAPELRQENRMAQEAKLETERTNVAHSYHEAHAHNSENVVPIFQQPATGYMQGNPFYTPNAHNGPNGPGTLGFPPQMPFFGPIPYQQYFGTGYPSYMLQSPVIGQYQMNPYTQGMAPYNSFNFNTMEYNFHTLSMMLSMSQALSTIIQQHLVFLQKMKEHGMMQQVQEPTPLWSHHNHVAAQSNSHYAQNESVSEEERQINGEEVEIEREEPHISSPLPRHDN